MDIVVEVEVWRLVLVSALGLVLAGLYAALLSTRAGREVCERRTHWTVVGGHVLMALTMCLVSPVLAMLWLGWSVLHGAPLVLRSEVLRWREEKEREQVFEAAMRARRGNEEGGDRGIGDGSGSGGAGV